jgi:hypothetical protein
MVAIAFLALVILALVNIAFWWVMRIRLMRVDSARDRIEWLSFRSGDNVLDRYAALFPRSVLPRYCRFAFWAVIVSAAIVLCAMTLLKAFWQVIVEKSPLHSLTAFSGPRREPSE